MRTSCNTPRPPSTGAPPRGSWSEHIRSPQTACGDDGNTKQHEAKEGHDESLQIMEDTYDDDDDDDDDDAEAGTRNRSARSRSRIKRIVRTSFYEVYLAGQMTPCCNSPCLMPVFIAS